jgi:hypothetical protein
VGWAGVGWGGFGQGGMPPPRLRRWTPPPAAAHLHAAGRVLKHQARARRHAPQPRRRLQEHVRRGLAVRHLVAAGDRV